MLTKKKKTFTLFAAWFMGARRVNDGSKCQANLSQSAWQASVSLRPKWYSAQSPKSATNFSEPPPRTKQTRPLKMMILGKAGYRSVPPSEYHRVGRRLANAGLMVFKSAHINFTEQGSSRRLLALNWNLQWNLAALKSAQRSVHKSHQVKGEKRTALRLFR